MILLLALGGCATFNAPSFSVCELRLDAEPAEGVPGDEVTLRGGPQSWAADTAIRVGGVAGDVLSVERDDSCLVCDACRVAAECLACGACPDCAELCEPCVETLAVRIPSAPAGATRIDVVNRFGSGSAAFRILGDPEDTGAPPHTADTGPNADTSATPDTGAPTDTSASIATGDTGVPPTTSTADTGTTTGDTGSSLPSQTGDTGAAPTSTADTGP